MKRIVERLVIQSATVHLGGRHRAQRGTCGCGSESVARVALGRNERPSEETSETACVHVDDAHERSSTPDDHETERFSVWIRNLETFSGREGAGAQSTVPSDADAIAAVSFYGKQRSGLGGVGTTRAADTLQNTIKAAILAHNPQDPEWSRHVGLNALRLQGYDALRIEWKAMHQVYRQWNMADGNDTTPMEVDALTKGKGKGKENGKEKGKEKGKAESEDKPKEGTSDKSSMKCFFCKEKGHARKDCPKFSAWLAEKKTVGHEQSANASRKTHGSLPWTTSMRTCAS